MRIGTFAYLVTGPPHSTILYTGRHAPAPEARGASGGVLVRTSPSDRRSARQWFIPWLHLTQSNSGRTALCIPPPRACARQPTRGGRPSTSAPDARATPGRRGGAPRTNRTRLTPRLSAHQVVTSGHHYIIERLNPQGTRAGDALRVRSSRWKYPGS
jgi:hypothetical protein